MNSANIFEAALRHTLQQTLHEDLFPVVWHLLQAWPSAVGLVELLAIYDGMDKTREQAVIDAADAQGKLDLFIADFQSIIFNASVQLAAFGLKIVPVNEFGYKVHLVEEKS